ncbi:substrate-binding domain-containing protein [Shinella sp.]|uniref:substrate-binding domain-containing protein n=1 Tax=Shinella sp. TaxID=1870904 RepID=UPI0029B8B94A|nr:substrate-binding domain-containing protein [Shinella sp.]MDX3978597.1 substrate-binding domain-containing protein [Shinella sp.]
MADAAKGPGNTRVTGGRELRPVAILADVALGQGASVLPMMREALARSLLPVVVPATDKGWEQIAALIPELAGAIVLTERLSPEALSAEGLAVVSVSGRAVPDARFDQVVLDAEAAGFRVAEYIASAGRTSVALIGPQGAHTRLEQGFAKGVDTYDLALPKDFIIACPPDSEKAVATFRSFLRAASVFPQVVYCTDPAVACGVYEALSAEGFRVPGDLWVLVHGETAMTRSPFYDMTSVTVPPEVVCSATLDLLCARLNNMDGMLIIRHIGFDIVAKSTTEHFRMAKALP